MARRYAIYDVFTETPLGGNPLAIVFDAEGLDGAAMQAIAREFNLSETVFVQPAENPAHSARLRIFTPNSELVFAGHPTVGTAIALAEQQPQGEARRLVVLEEGIGPVRCALRVGEPSYAEFDVPQLAEQVEYEVDKAMIAAVIGVDPNEVGFENHQVSVWTAGNSFVFVPLDGLGPLRRISVSQAQWEEIAPAPVVNGKPAWLYVYTRDTIQHDFAFHSRMLAPGAGVPEDPATGSAAANFSSVIALFDGVADGPSVFMIEQGYEMGRPSQIRLEITGKAGAIHGARIGGHAVKVAEGVLTV